MALLANSRTLRPNAATRGTLAAQPTLYRAPRLPRRDVTAAAQKQQYESFDDMLARSELPLLVDFYATWCGPCQMMLPILTAVQTKMKGKLQVVKIDTDKYPGIASQHRVQALPTIALFIKGKMVFRFEGVLNEGQIIDKVNYYLSGAASKQ
ncbi:hypothetical protein HYH02_005099 [Chlamydomonas schloesseri]|uniref:Thioredoxin domain-containing protein n=1 Tax=Chlamydomonas schloesseri TaxID=2026947 RepID=A0A835WMA0_9CHLO|nr:hypothetical protein HYH02_005099 [Chlamydomonas schloesseri]|eukprot:KAG2449566.1 hypothetical protein HYH02_005099 [Chlamydomonas schloesseri]